MGVQNRNGDRSLRRELLEFLAEQFRVLGDPVRLRLLDLLRAGEKTVADLVAETGLRQANVSKHLQILYRSGFVTRRKSGLNVYYRLADEAVFELCDILCRRLRADIERQRRALEGTLPPAAQT